MKKFFSLLLLATPLLMFTSCDDDKDLPDVDVSINIDGGVSVDGTIYVVQGDVLDITAINVTNREHGKEALITSATYTWDYAYVATSVTPPYGIEFETVNVPVGTHLLQIECPLYAVDKSAAIMYIAYKVCVVPSVDDIPAGQAATEISVNPGIKAS